MEKPVSAKAGRTSETADAFQVHSRKTKITNTDFPYIYISLLLRSNPQQAALKGTISLRGQEKRNTGKRGKLGVKRKW